LKIVIKSSLRKRSIDKKKIERAVKIILESKKVIADEVVINFVGKKKIKSLHKKFFNDDTITDCITFPLDEPFEKSSEYKILGEVFVCVPVAIEYAFKHNIDEDDEVLLYVVHGLLHLLGFEDYTDKQRIVMQKNEKKCINLIKGRI
jgi:probable rRNA maturation factor